MHQDLDEAITKATRRRSRKTRRSKNRQDPWRRTQKLKRADKCAGNLNFTGSLKQDDARSETSKRCPSGSFSICIQNAASSWGCTVESQWYGHGWYEVQGYMNSWNLSPCIVYSRQNIGWSKLSPAPLWMIQTREPWLHPSTLKRCP